MAFALGQELLGLIGLATGVKVKRAISAFGTKGKRGTRKRKIEVENEIDYLMAIPVEELTENKTGNITVL